MESFDILTEEEFLSNNRLRSALAILILLIPYPILVFLTIVFSDTNDELFLAFFVVFLTIISLMGSAKIFADLEIRPRTLRKAYEILKRLGSSDLVITRKFVLALKDDVYIFALGTGMMYFIAFRGAQREGERNRINVPKRFSESSEQVEIAGVKLYVKEGEFTVPSPYRNYYTGDALLYSVRYKPAYPTLIVPDFTKEEVSEIIRNISEAVKRDYNP